jgi:hypothetical protein
MAKIDYEAQLAALETLIASAGKVAGELNSLPADRQHFLQSCGMESGPGLDVWHGYLMGQHDAYLGFRDILRDVYTTIWTMADEIENK